MERFTDRELEALLDDLESELAERKSSFKGDTPKKARQAVCAFANDLPNHNKAGVLFIGATDDGAPSGEPITDDLLRRLAHMKTDGNTLPLPVLSVEKRKLKGADMAVVTVMPSDMPPVKYDGRIWIRTGSRRDLASEQEERILIEKRRYKILPFDIYPVPTAKVNDLSKVIFENEYLPAAFAADVLASNSRAYEERLASCKMIVAPEEQTPTVLAILAIGKTPRDFLPGSAIQFLRIDGEDLADPVVIPLGADLFSLQGLRNLGPTLKSWKNLWKKRLDNWRDSNESRSYPKFELPHGQMEPIGYLCQQHGVRLDRPVKAYDKWVKRIPNVYRQAVLDQKDNSAVKPTEDPHCLATIKHYRSLIPMAQEHRKPIFYLTSADGAIGSHANAVRDAKADFKHLAEKIAAKVGLAL